VRGIKSGLSAILAIGLLAGSAVGVGAQEEAAEPTAPVEFTGKVAFGGCTGSATIESSEGRTRTLSADNGRYCRPPVIEPFSDPRLQGDYYVWQNNDVHVDGPEIYATAFSIVNDEGAWRGIPDIILDGEAPSVQTLVGEGAYEGLTAISRVDLDGSVWSWHGWIIEGDVPPLPAEPEGIMSPPDRSIGDTPDDAEPPDEATVVDVAEVDERIRDLTIESPAVGTKSVRLILPDRFDEEPERSWPVLYLLHGQGGSHLDWTMDTSIATTLSEELDVLLVMPDAGAGYYSDWWNEGEGGPPMWETFHIDELLPLLEADWRAGERRALAGVSMGGFGAMSYAARHPDLFAGAASFSGVLDPFGSDWQYDPALWGSKEEQADIWRAHDPVTLAPALADTQLYVWYGDGAEESDGPVVDGLEAYLSPHSAAFVDRIRGLGIDATVESGPGVHGWASWDEAVLSALPVLRSALEEERPVD